MKRLWELTWGRFWQSRLPSRYHRHYGIGDSSVEGAGLRRTVAG
ncbi:hypothetical protein [Weissella cibaria]|nr:hypothetical protein [Weissella cibaria]